MTPPAGTCSYIYDVPRSDDDDDDVVLCCVVSCRIVGLVDSEVECAYNKKRKKT